MNHSLASIEARILSVICIQPYLFATYGEDFTFLQGNVKADVSKNFLYVFGPRIRFPLIQIIQGACIYPKVIYSCILASMQYKYVIQYMSWFVVSIKWRRALRTLDSVWFWKLSEMANSFKIFLLSVTLELIIFILSETYQTCSVQPTIYDPYHKMCGGGQRTKLNIFQYLIYVYSV